MMKEAYKNMNTDLDCCPFCGWPVQLERFHTDNTTACVKCPSCGVVVSFEGGERPAEFTQRWNRRDMPFFCDFIFSESALLLS